MISPFLYTASAILGSYLILKLLYSFASFLRVTFRSSSLSRYCHSNAYAVITGASDGIGLGFAQELLSAGFNVILHGRNESKLREIQGELKKQHPNKDVRYYIADAARIGLEGEIQMNGMMEQFKDLPITVLMNNLGGMVGVDPVFDTLENRSPAQVEHIIALNSIYPTQMARAFLPILKKHEPSLMMNISSIAAVLPTPFGTIYNGAKAYLVHWSHSLGVEMSASKRNVEVILIEVGTVLTTGNPTVTTTGLFTPTARDMARNTLQKAGCGKWKVVGYWAHALQKNCLYWLPEGLMEMACEKISIQIKEQQDEKLKKGK